MGLPGSSSGQDSAIPTQMMWVRSLDSHKTRAGHEDSAMGQGKSRVILNQVARGGVSEEVIVEQYPNEVKEQDTSSRGRACQVEVTGSGKALGLGYVSYYCREAVVAPV